MQIDLIGILHRDNELYERTTRALECLRPAVICIEWAGPEYETFLASEEFVSQQGEINRRVRAVFAELGQQELYDQIYREHLPEPHIDAAKNYAERNQNVRIIPTDSAEHKIYLQREWFQQKEAIIAHWRNWLVEISNESQTGLQTEDNELEYTAFEQHLAGKMPLEKVYEWLDKGYISSEIITPARVAYQVQQITQALELLHPEETFIHIGGLAHLLDDGLSSTERGPINLYQTLSRPSGIESIRHSIRKI